MQVWFDLLSTSLTKPPQDEKGMLESAGRIKQLIRDEMSTGTEASRIILGGFSQGGTMSLLSSLTGEFIDLAGVVVLSGRLPLLWKFKEMASERVSSMPIFWAHGTDDRIVPFDVGKKSVDLLTNELGFSFAKDDERTCTALTFKTYEGLEHDINVQEATDLQAWLRKAIPQV